MVHTRTWQLHQSRLVPSELRRFSTNPKFYPFLLQIYLIQTTYSAVLNEKIMRGHFLGALSCVSWTILVSMENCDFQNGESNLCNLSESLKIM